MSSKESNEVDKSTQNEMSVEEIAREALLRAEGGRNHYENEIREVAKVIQTERSQREKVEREVERLKDSDGLLKQFNHKSQQFIEAMQELTSLKKENERLKGDCHCGESHRLKIQMASLRSCLEKARIDIKCLVNAVENNRECLFCMKNSITIKEHNGECCLKDFNKTLTSIDEVMK